MKKTLLFALLCISQFGFGQFALEHDYPDGLTKKITLEYSGEKYMVYDNVAHRMDFYNTDHSFWKSIVLQMPVAAYSYNYYDNVSESKINPDANIELSYSYSYQVNGEWVYVSKIINDAGVELMSFANGYRIEINTDGGLSPKLLLTQFNGPSEVYALPSLTLEHSFPPSLLSRIKLENSGEKYYYHDSNVNQLKIFNADFSQWKTIGTPMPDGAEFYGADVVSENEINADALIEIAYTHVTNGIVGFTFGGMVINENGTVLLDAADVSEFTLDQIDGLDNKLLAFRYSTGVNTTRVFHLPDMALEHAYPEYMARTKLEVSGEKYFAPFVNQNAAVIYNSDHSLWKTVALSVNDPFDVYRINELSESKFTADNTLGIVYTTRWIMGDIVYFYQSRIADEFQNVMLTVADASNLYLIKVGAEDKLLANLYDDGAFSFDVGGQIYSIDPVLQTEAFQNTSSAVFPNPANERVFVKSPHQIHSATLYDGKGMMVQNWTSNNITEIETSNLANAIYFLKLVNSQGENSNHKIMVAH